MRTAGIDIGSRTIKLAVVDGESLVLQRVVAGSHDPLAACRGLLDGVEFDRIGATGYGRMLFSRYLDGTIVEDVRALAMGAAHCHRQCRTVLEIGGQVTKALSLDGTGALTHFHVNDRCAAGTGRFLDVTAAALGYSTKDFIQAAREADAPKRIEASCTVFAESEVIALAARGVPRAALALGLHQSVAAVALGLAGKVPFEEPVLLCGGVAHNACIRELLELGLQTELVVADRPQLLPAIGAALAVVPEEVDQ